MSNQSLGSQSLGGLNIIRIFAYVAVGGLTLGGSTDIQFTKVHTTSGGLTAGGSAQIRIVRSYDAGGSIFSSDGALFSFTKVYEALGGLISDGSALYSKTLTIEPSGGLISSGQAEIKFTKDFIGSGGLILSGNAGLGVVEVYPSGGMIVSGTADRSFTKVHVASGGLISYGGSGINITFSFMPSGGLTLGGFAWIGDIYHYEWEHGGPGFMVNDLVIAFRSDFDINEQFGNKTNIYTIKGIVFHLDKEGEAYVQILSGKEYINDYGEGIEFVKIGNTKDPDRQGSILLTTEGTHQPYIDIIDGVNTFDPNEETGFQNINTVKARIGNLNGITDPNFGSLENYGIYTRHGYFKGKLAVGDAVSLTQGIGAWIDKLGSVRFGDPQGNYLKFDVATEKLTIKTDSLLVVTNTITIDSENEYIKVQSGFDTYVRMDAEGLYGYNSIIGARTFIIPTDPNEPVLFSHGVIESATWVLTTQAVIKTSETALDGSPLSAGIVINKDGIFGGGANQTTLNANFRLITDGLINIIGATIRSSDAANRIEITNANEINFYDADILKTIISFQDNALKLSAISGGIGVLALGTLQLLGGGPVSIQSTNQWITINAKGLYSFGFIWIVSDNGDILINASQELRLIGNPITSNNIYYGYGGDVFWHSANDGSGSGLDADLLDGVHSAVTGTFNNPTSITVNKGLITAIS